MPELNTFPKYGLEQPTVESSIAALSRMIGPEEAETRWARACAEVAVSWPARTLGLSELGAVAKYLSKENDLVSVVGCAILIRINAYQGIRRKLQNEEGRA